MTELESAIRETVEGILTPEIVEKARDMALQCANADEITEIVGRSLDGTEGGGASPPSGRTELGVLSVNDKTRSFSSFGENWKRRRRFWRTR